MPFRCQLLYDTLNINVNLHCFYYYYHYYYYDFTVHKTKGNMAIKYEIVTECTEGTPVGGAGALGTDRALQRTNNIK